MCETFKGDFGCRVNFSQGAELSQSWSLQPTTGGDWRTGWWGKRQRWGIVMEFFGWCFFLQVLLFSPSTNAWTLIAKLKTKRGFHAIAEVNLRAVCFGIGNLNPLKNHHHHHHYHHHHHHGHHLCYHYYHAWLCAFSTQLGKVYDMLDLLNFDLLTKL